MAADVLHHPPRKHPLAVGIPITRITQENGRSAVAKP